MKKTLTIGILCLFLFSCGRTETTDDAIETSMSELSVSDEQQSGRQKQIEAGQVTAGEWNDLKNWTFWNKLNKDSEFSEMDQYWSYNLDNRISVNLKNETGNLVDIPVELIDAQNQIIWQSKTNNKGNAELWPFQKNSSQSTLSNLKIKIGDELFENPKVYKDKEINNIVLAKTVQPATEKIIDIAFMVDATGSMGDELEFLKVELVDVVAKVKTQNPTAIINMGVVFYRDKGEDYVTRKSDFSTNIQQTISFIKRQSADGGGDFPEAVDAALGASLKKLEWSANATSRILFLVLDAPPHYDKQVISEIHNLVLHASSKGIKIIPIVASGIDKETEFLMRYMAIATNGTYVFITDDSGIGNEHLEASVGEYQVELLNKLMTQLINESLE